MSNHGTENVKTLDTIDGDTAPLGGKGMATTGNGGAGGAEATDPPSTSARASAAATTAASAVESSSWHVVLDRTDDFDELGGDGVTAAGSGKARLLGVFDERVDVSVRQQGRRMLTTVSGLSCRRSALLRVVKSLKRELATAVKVQTAEEAEAARKRGGKHKDKDVSTRRKGRRERGKEGTDGDPTSGGDTGQRFVLVIQGDHRTAVCNALVNANLCDAGNVRFHGVGR